jgi:copper(I)-binding protein
VHSRITATGISVASSAEQEAPVDRFKPRTSAVTAGLAACGLAATLALSGCGTGQISQTATQEPAVNGTSANIGDISLRNIHLRAVQSTDYIQPGREVELIFVAANNSPDVDDKLVSITSDIGTVSIAGDTTLPAGGVLVVGEPDGQIASLESAKLAEGVEATVALTKPITNGLTYNFTFSFQQNGQTTVPVPISAGEAPRREQQVDTGGHH